MAKIAVQFRYLTGLKRDIFRNARLTGSWDSSGRFAQTWSETPMTPGRAEDGCPCFTANVEFDGSEVGKQFRWGVRLDGPTAPNAWGIPTEINDGTSSKRYREFELETAGGTQEFYFTYARRLGARKFFSDGSQQPDLRFSVWAPNARESKSYSASPRMATSPMTATGSTQLVRYSSCTAGRMASGKATSFLTSRRSKARLTCIGLPMPRSRSFTGPTFFRATRSAAAERILNESISPAAPRSSTAPKAAAWL